ncbi:hypothetical protein EBZ80_13975 [bacterium]|nr:hypothetical protein [bacterium]
MRTLRAFLSSVRNEIFTQCLVNVCIALHLALLLLTPSCLFLLLCLLLLLLLLLLLHEGGGEDGRCASSCCVDRSAPMRLFISQPYHSLSFPFQK